MRIVDTNVCEDVRGAEGGSRAKNPTSRGAFRDSEYGKYPYLVGRFLRLLAADAEEHQLCGTRE